MTGDETSILVNKGNGAMHASKGMTKFITNTVLLCACLHVYNQRAVDRIGYLRHSGRECSCSAQNWQ